MKIEPRFKPGDRVRIARKIPGGDPRDVNNCGWFMPGKDRAIGKPGTVGRISKRGNVWVDVDGVGSYLFPDAALEYALYGNEEDA